MISEETRCRGCGAMILFVRTVQGNAMPVQKKRISVVTAEGRVVQGYEPHWGYCTAHKRFRGPPREGRRKGEVTREEAHDLLTQIREDLDRDDPNVDDE